MKRTQLIYTDDEWSPYLSVSDAMKLDDVREALRQKDFATATQLVPQQVKDVG
jgi:hypothetical protein